MTIVTMVQVLMLVACDKCSVSGVHLSCDMLFPSMIHGTLLMYFYQHSYSSQSGNIIKNMMHSPYVELGETFSKNICIGNGLAM